MERHVVGTKAAPSIVEEEQEQEQEQEFEVAVGVSEHKYGKSPIIQ